MDADTLRRLARQNQRDKLREIASYNTLVEAIWEAHDEGLRQGEIVAAVGLTRERVRIICSPEYREKRESLRSPSA
jgi:hypothetical protein